MTTAVVTLLFCDIAGSTDLLTRVGDEAAERLRRRYFRALRDDVERHGGTEVKSLGDGLMVAFASAAAAVDCAVGMQRSIARLNRRDRTLELHLRVGLSLGEATSEDGDWFGTPVVEAARLCAGAEPGQVLAADVVRAVAATRTAFGFSEATLVEAKGIPDGIPAVEVLWEDDPSDGPTIPAPLSDVPTLFVGREEEVEELRRAWKTCTAGDRQVVLIGGDAGIGKTRLAAEVARRVHGEGHVLYGRCEEGLGVAYAPFADALRPLVSELDDDVLERAADVSPGHLAHLLPAVRDRLGVNPVPWTEPESDRYVLFQAVSRLLSVTSEHVPLLLVVDDLHWATTPTLLLLRHLVRSPEPMALLLLGTYRDTAVDVTPGLADLLADLRRDVEVGRPTLRGLDVEEVATYVAASTGLPHDDRLTGLARALHAEVAGNPFFLREVLAHLTETGRIDTMLDDPGSGLRVEDFGLPESVAEVIERRLARLSAATNHVLAVAAIVGRRFRVSLLERVEDTGGPDAVVEGLDEAMRARLVTDTGPGELEFSHALVQETVTAGLTSVRGARLHLAVGEAIESLPGSDGEVEALARHFAQAGSGSVDKAARYAAEAAHRAIERFAFEEAAEHADRGLRALEDAAAPAPDGLRLDLLLRVAEAHVHAASDWEGVRDAALAAAVEARRLRDSERLGHAARLVIRHFPVGAHEPEVLALLHEAVEALAGDHGVLRSQVLSGAILAGFGREFGDADARSLEALGVARSAGNPTAVSDALAARGLVLRIAGRRNEYRDAAGEILALGESSGNPFIRCLGLSERARARLILGDVAGYDADTAELARAGAEVGGQYETWGTISRVVRLLLDGAFEDAERVAAEALGRAPHPNDHFVFLGQLFVSMWERGRFDDVLPVLAETASSAEGIAAFTAGHAALAAEAGDHDAARATFDRLMSGGADGLPQDVVWTGTVSLLAQAAALLGARDEAEDLAAALQPHSGGLIVVADTVGAFGAADRYLGMLAAVRGLTDEAEQRYRAALDLEARIGSRPLQARTRLWLARLTDDRALAQSVASEARLLGMAGIVADAERVA